MKAKLFFSSVLFLLSASLVGVSPIYAQGPFSKGETVEFFVKPGEWMRGKVLAVGAGGYRIQAEGLPNTYQVPLSSARVAPPVKNNGQTDIQVGDYVEVMAERGGKTKQWVIGRVVEIKGVRYKVEYGGKYNSAWYELNQFRSLAQEQQMAQNQALGKDFYQDLLPYRQTLATWLAKANPQEVWGDPRKTVNNLADLRQAREELNKAAQIVAQKYPQIENPPPNQMGGSLLSAPGTVRKMLEAREVVTDQFEHGLLMQQGKLFLETPGRLNDVLLGQPLMNGNQKLTWDPYLACNTVPQLKQLLEKNLAGYIRDFGLNAQPSDYLPNFDQVVAQRQAKVQTRLSYPFSQTYKYHLPAAEAKVKQDLKGSALKMGFSSNQWEVVMSGGVPKGRKRTGAAMWKATNTSCNLCAWDRFNYWEDYLGGGRYGNGKIMWEISSELIQCQR